MSITGSALGDKQAWGSGIGNEDGWQTGVADLNGDGMRDRFESSDGTEIEIYLGGGNEPLQNVSARQKLDAHGLIRFGDLNRDGLTDALLFSPDRPGNPIRVLVNRGVLPGTPRRAIVQPGA